MEMQQKKYTQMETLLQLLKEQTIQIEDHKNTVHHLNKQIQELSQAKQKQMEEIQLTKKSNPKIRTNY